MTSFSALKLQRLCWIDVNINLIRMNYVFNTGGSDLMAQVGV